MIVIDGSFKEGGGQIVRTAVALSAITKKPVKIINIRAKRCDPGLKSQHVCAINAVAELCGAKTKGVEAGSKEIEFYPGELTEGPLKVEIPTAGSISLVMQALLIPGMHVRKPLKITICGGATFGKWAPPITYTEEVLRYVLSKIGYVFNVFVERHGFYPKGGAKVLLEIEPIQTLRPFNIAKTEKLALFGLSIASSGLKAARVAERQKDAAERRINQKIEIKSVYSGTVCPGSALVLWGRGETSAIGADSLGERGLSAEKVGSVAGDTFSAILSKAEPVDLFLADQLIPYLAFAKGTIMVQELTPHTETNMWVVERFLGEIFVVDRARNTISVL